MDRIEAMRAFVAVCDAQGFAAAARRLQISPSVVTRLVSGLEERLGVRLLERTTRSLHLTEAGARYLARVREVLAGIEEAEDSARTDQSRPRGHLVVAAPVMFGRLHVAPLLRLYMDRSPDVSVELVLGDRNAAMVEEGIDVALRIGALADSGLVARRLGETARVVVASPDYLRRQGRPEHPDELSGHDTIAFQPSQARREWAFLDRRGAAPQAMSVAISPRFGTNGGEAAIEHALDGRGLVRCLLYQVAGHVAEGRLVAVLGAFAPEPSPIHAVLPSGRLLPAKTRAFVDLATAEAEWRFGR